MIVEGIQIFIEYDLHAVSVPVDGVFDRVQRHGLKTVDGTIAGKHDSDAELPVLAPDGVAVGPGTGQNRVPRAGIDRGMIVEDP